MTGSRRDRLQKTSSGRILAHSSMNDFPIPEDPPVMMTAEKFLRAASGVGIWRGEMNFRRRKSVRLRSIKQESNAHP
jgi:hypothetical protein